MIPTSNTAPNRSGTVTRSLLLLLLFLLRLRFTASIAHLRLYFCEMRCSWLTPRLICVHPCFEEFKVLLTVLLVVEADVAAAPFCDGFVAHVVDEIFCDRYRMSSKSVNSLESVLDRGSRFLR